jgi:protein tyrosine phosphatase (PTP) superfamily phosphohydrolase (DUF442 family)
MTIPGEALQGLPNACQVLPTVVTGGQPTQQQLAAFKAAGGRQVLDLRDAMEPRGFDERAAAEGLGLDYTNVSIWTGSLTDDTLDRVLEVLRGAGDHPVLVHCASGNRVGGALLPFLMIDHGLEEEEAVGQAMRIGLRSAELMEWGLDYTRRHRKG